MICHRERNRSGQRLLRRSPPLARRFLGRWVFRIVTAAGIAVMAASNSVRAGEPNPARSEAQRKAIPRTLKASELTELWESIAQSDNINQTYSAPHRYELAGRLADSRNTTLRGLGRQLTELYVMEDVDDFYRKQAHDRGVQVAREIQSNFNVELVRQLFGGDPFEGAARITTDVQDKMQQSAEASRESMPVRRFLARRRAITEVIATAQRLSALLCAGKSNDGLLRPKLRILETGRVDASGRLSMEARNTSTETLHHCVVVVTVQMDSVLAVAQSQGALVSTDRLVLNPDILEILRLPQSGVLYVAEWRPGKVERFAFCNPGGWAAAASVTVSVYADELCLPSETIPEFTPSTPGSAHSPTLWK